MNLGSVHAWNVVRRALNKLFQSTNLVDLRVKKVLLIQYNFGFNWFASKDILTLFLMQRGMGTLNYVSGRNITNSLESLVCGACVSNFVTCVLCNLWKHLEKYKFLLISCLDPMWCKIKNKAVYFVLSLNFFFSINQKSKYLLSFYSFFSGIENQ